MCLHCLLLTVQYPTSLLLKIEDADCSSLQLSCNVSRSFFMPVVSTQRYLFIGSSQQMTVSKSSSYPGIAIDTSFSNIDAWLCRPSATHTSETSLTLLTWHLKLGAMSLSIIAIWGRSVRSQRYGSKAQGNRSFLWPGRQASVGCHTCRRHGRHVHIRRSNLEPLYPISLLSNTSASQATSKQSFPLLRYCASS